MKFFFLFCLILLLVSCAYSTKQQHLATGTHLRFQRDKGNCLACHIIDDGEEPGNIGPALVDIQVKFSEKSQLKAIVWDATQFNAQSSMPPFGRNEILTAEELDLVVDYIWSLDSRVMGNK